VRALADAIAEKFADEGETARRRVRSAVLMIGLMAFGDAVVGPQLRGMLGSDDEAARRVAAHQVPSFFL